MSLSDPFAAFVMSEFHEAVVEALVREEELAAVPGQVECRTDPGGAMHSISTSLGLTCPGCKAVV